MNQLALFWRLIKPYWWSRQRLPSLALLFVVLATSLSSVWFSVELNQWNGDFYNALQKLDGSQIYPLLKSYIIIIGALILVLVYSDYLQKKLVIQWREWMTKDLCRRWLSKDSHHYRLQLNQEEPDNPDQRIAEDVKLLVETSLTLLLSFLRSVLTLGSFIVILWNLSGNITLPLGGGDLEIPGYMVWVCVLYTLLGTGITHVIGKPLHQLNFQQQKREADFRVALVQRRQHSEAIAGQQGEGRDRDDLNGSFREVALNWYSLMIRDRNLSFFTTGYAQITMMAPIFFALPQFLSGTILLGGLMQIRMAFSKVSGALSWFIYAYRDLAKWSATIERLSRFEDTLDQQVSHRIKPVKSASGAGELILRAQLNTHLNHGKPLLNNVSLLLSPGTLTILHGRSGLGKTSLLRTLSGFDPNFDGKIAHSEKAFWIPQRLYLGGSTLKSIITYPQCGSSFSQHDCEFALKRIGLTHLIDELDESGSWQQRLSSGEQQRVMFGRLLLNRPKLILLDETTSALDTKAAIEMLTLLREELSESAVVLVTHQTQLHEYADTVVNLESNYPNKIREARELQEN
ncbi:ABC transporter ATP-binding protein/permease [Endozoicomonas gorgoniicola]|uniref:ABC transporter ATP-binding protein/permease n=1 Tax=Endozoicomonas gorgoniicola TaxID=1234144 RepID=A0ABT3N3R6_9GAMM|nr:ABC transporter ATP-binding protein/permease [Endozoicomonas gorgoniicola]MCW7556283.1 ABC transporter ATP-binding protein/permease [Endozoicomonas gorgoniicola]